MNMIENIVVRILAAFLTVILTCLIVLYTIVEWPFVKAWTIYSKAFDLAYPHVRKLGL